MTGVTAIAQCTSCSRAKNSPMHYMEIFSAVKIKIFSRKVLIFSLLAQNTDCGYTLEMQNRGGYNEHPQSMFWIKKTKIRYTPANPNCSILTWGLMGYTFHGHVFLDEYGKSPNIEAFVLVVSEKKIFSCISHCKPMADNDDRGWGLYGPQWQG